MALIQVEYDKSQISENVKLILDASTSAQVAAGVQSFKIIVDAAKRLIVQDDQFHRVATEFQARTKERANEYHKRKQDLVDSGASPQELARAHKQYRQSRARLRAVFNFNDIIKPAINRVYQTATQLQAYLNAALGQEIVTAYAFIKGNMKAPQVYVSHDLDNFVGASMSSDQTVVLKYRSAKRYLDNAANHIQNISKALRQQEQKQHENLDLDLLQSTYAQVVSRYRAHPVKGGHLVLWLNPGGGGGEYGFRWHGTMVYTMGSINEAYSSFLLHEKFNPGINPAEINIQTFMTADGGVDTVSAVKGSLQGDVTIGNIEVAVKSIGASTLQISQMRELAEEIIKHYSDFNALQQYLRKKKQSNYEQGSKRLLNKSVTDLLQEIVDEQIGEAYKSAIAAVKANL